MQIISQQKANAFGPLPHPPDTATPTPILLTQPIHTPLLSSARHTHTSLDLSIPLKPNQTATPVKPHRMVKTVQRAAWSCPVEEWNCSGNTRAFSSVGFVCQLWSEPANSPYSACSGSFKIDSALCKIYWSQSKDTVLTFTDHCGAKIQNFL